MKLVLINNTKIRDRGHVGPRRRDEGGKEPELRGGEGQAKTSPRPAISSCLARHGAAPVHQHSCPTSRAWPSWASAVACPTSLRSHVRWVAPRMSATMKIAMDVRLYHQQVNRCVCVGGACMQRRAWGRGGDRRSSPHRTLKLDLLAISGGQLETLKVSQACQVY